jgi:rhodanese-related sulfurtransferase
MKRIKLLILISFVLFSPACLGEGGKNAEMTIDSKLSEVTGRYNASEITATEFMEMYREGGDYVLIDVRTEFELKSGYIPGAVHIPHTELESRIGELNIPKDQRIVVYCEAGVRSKKGANALLDEGYTNIIDITDGMVGWRALDGELAFPVTEERPVETTDPPSTTSLPSTTEAPTVTTTTSTTIIDQTTTTTMWSETTQPPPQKEENYLEVEPVLTLESVEGTQTIHMTLWNSYKVGDGYIYLTGDMDGCVGIFWWDFNIYQDTPDGGVWEGSETYMNEEVHSPMDISDDIHKVSDAFDDYKIVVTKWKEVEGLTVEISQ